MSAIASRCTTSAMVSQSTTSSNASHFTYSRHVALSCDTARKAPHCNVILRYLCIYQIQQAKCFGA